MTTGFDISREPGMQACPFCHNWRLTIRPRFAGVQVDCDTCHAEGPLARDYPEAIRRWNNREKPEPVTFVFNPKRPI